MQTAGRSSYAYRQRHITGNSGRSGQADSGPLNLYLNAIQAIGQHGVISVRPAKAARA